MSFHEYYHIATDDTLRETLSHGSGSYPFAYYLEDAWQFDFHCIDWHWHHEVEFLTVTEGRLLCCVGEHQLEVPEGSGLFVNSGILHRYEAPDGRTITPNIVFSPALLAPEESLIYEKYVRPVISAAPAYCRFDPQIGWQRDVLEKLKMIYSLQEKDADTELQTLQLLLAIWYRLFASMDRNREAPRMRHVTHKRAKLQMMMQYIHDHYEKSLTLEEIAAAALVSKSSALNIFQESIHTSPVSYLIAYRLKCAGRLLRTTEKTVSIIADETGFSSVGYFCRKFKEYYQMTPYTYRKESLHAPSSSR